jgi:hypothetical protein
MVYACHGGRLSYWAEDRHTTRRMRRQFYRFLYHKGRPSFHVPSEIDRALAGIAERHNVLVFKGTKTIGVSVQKEGSC